MDFTTARLTLRPITLADMEPLHALYSDPALMRYIIGRPRTREETRACLGRHATDFAAHGIGLYLAYLTATGELIGRCGVGPLQRSTGLEGGLAWMFREAWWGQGLATEFARAFVPFAFARAPFARLFAHADHRNEASINVMRKLGMRYVGREAWAPELYEVEYELTRAMFEAGWPTSPPGPLPPVGDPALHGEGVTAGERGGEGEPAATTSGRRSHRGTEVPAHGTVSGRGTEVPAHGRLGLKPRGIYAVVACPGFSKPGSPASTRAPRSTRAVTPLPL